MLLFCFFFNRYTDLQAAHKRIQQSIEELQASKGCKFIWFYIKHVACLRVFSIQCVLLKKSLKLYEGIVCCITDVLLMEKGDVIRKIEETEVSMVEFILWFYLLSCVLCYLILIKKNKVNHAFKLFYKLLRCGWMQMQESKTTVF